MIKTAQTKTSPLVFRTPTRMLFVANVVAVLATCFSYQSAVAQPYYVRAATRVQTAGFGVVDGQYNDNSTGNVQALSISSGPFTASSNSGTVTATAYSLAKVGSLHGYASASALAGDGGLATSGDAQNTGSLWADTIMVTSDTLADGTPVQLEATLVFDRELSGSGDPFVTTNASLSGVFNLAISDDIQNPNPTRTAKTTFTWYVGYSFQVFGQLYFTANAGTSSGHSYVTSDIDVSNTARFKLEPLNPAVSYTTASGVMYNVPEPAALALAMSGVFWFSSRRARRAFAIALVAWTSCGITAMQVRADFLPIAQPDAAYLAATTLIPITADDNEIVTSLTDGYQTITIDPTIAQTVPTTWDTWSSPPDSETATPRVLYTGSGIGFLTMYLERPSRIFGIEVQGNLEEAVPEIFVTFYRNGNEVGFIGMPIDGNAGSRLFAASTTTSIFDSVSVAIDFLVDDSGFGMAQFRYGDSIPEPATLALGCLGLIGCLQRRRA